MVRRQERLFGKGKSETAKKRKPVPGYEPTTPINPDKEKAPEVKTPEQVHEQLTAAIRDACAQILRMPEEDHERAYLLMLGAFDKVCPANRMAAVIEGVKRIEPAASRQVSINSFLLRGVA